MERRIYSRIKVEIPGTLYVDKKEIPITIYNISEKGIGFRYQYKDCETLGFRLTKKQRVNIVFFDSDERIFRDNAVQHAEFTVIQTRDHSKHSYIGGKLAFSDTGYEQYVLDKKSLRFVKLFRNGKIRHTNIPEVSAI